MEDSEPAIPAEILEAVLALNESQRRALGHRLIESAGVEFKAPYPG